MRLQNCNIYNLERNGVSSSSNKSSLSEIINRDPWICQYRHLRDLRIQVRNNRPQGSFAQNDPWRDSEGLLDVQFNAIGARPQPRLDLGSPALQWEPIVDMPVPDKILRMIPHSLPKERDEFTHAKIHCFQRRQCFRFPPAGLCLAAYIIFKTTRDRAFIIHLDS